MRSHWQVIALVAVLATAVLAQEEKRERLHDQWAACTFYLIGQRPPHAPLNVTPANVSAIEGSSELAKAIYNASVPDVGWDYFYVEPNSGFFPSNASWGYYYAGYLEGYVTAARMAQVIPTQLPNFTALTAAQQQIVVDHINYMENASSWHAEHKDGDVFWLQVHNLFRLMQGIVDGYAAAQVDPAITFQDIFLYNFQNELDDMLGNGGDELKRSRPKAAKYYYGQHCSALVKVTDKDLFVSHDTWYLYSAMVREYKTYAFETTVSMTGYVALISSTDDWYVTSNKLAVQETSTGFYNDSLYQYVTPQSVSEFIRVMVANFLAKDGQTWSQLFAQENSGTYCNQYMVVDAKLYTPKQPLPDGLLWIAEQIPGRVESKDMTETLRNTSYWASYNIPYFPDIYQESGFAGKEQTEGLFWSYEQCPRAKMFRAGESAVKDLNGMKQLMRQNNYKTDPNAIIPNCTTCDPPYSPLCAIAIRGDLVDPNAILPPNEDYRGYFEIGAFGSIDCKIAAWSDLHLGHLVGYVISGPTTENGLPPFQFSTSPFSSNRTAGSPDLFDFDWVTYTIPEPPPHGYVTVVSTRKKIVIGIVAIVVGLTIIISVLFIIHRPHKRSTDEYLTVE